ncbi:MAG: CapA family protein [Ginsengibacter sp.]
MEQKKKSTIITICGDICPTQDTEPYFKSGDHKKLFGNCIPFFNSSGLLMGNLEFPIIDNGKGIVKSGPVLKGDDNYIDIFKKSGFHVLGLANNHIKDCGEEGVKNTMAVCTQNGISYVGAGENISKAKIPLIREVNGKKIGILAFAEQEFNIATEDEYGANYLDVYDDFDAIRGFKNEVDYLIILYHGGIEYYEYPSPLLQKRCRKMIDSGADLVTCQHSHCIGTTEKYHSGNIVYGQGNTLFGYRKGSESWNEGLLLQITLPEEKSISSQLDFIPVVANVTGVELMAEKKAKERLEKFFDQSLMIADKEFIKKSWLEFCNKKKTLYMPFIFGFNRILIHSNRILKNEIVKGLFSKQKLRVVTNLIRCESHKEVLDTIFQNEIKTKKS